MGKERYRRRRIGTDSMGRPIYQWSDSSGNFPGDAPSDGSGSPDGGENPGGDYQYGGYYFDGGYRNAMMEVEGSPAVSHVEFGDEHDSIYFNDGTSMHMSFSEDNPGRVVISLYQDDGEPVEWEDSPVEAEWFVHEITQRKEEQGVSGSMLPPEMKMIAADMAWSMSQRRFRRYRARRRSKKQAKKKARKERMKVNNNEIPGFKSLSKMIGHAFRPWG